MACQKVCKQYANNVGMISEGKYTNTFPASLSDKSTM